MKILNFINIAIVFTLITSIIMSSFYSTLGIITFYTALFIMPTYQLLVGLFLLIDTNNKEIRNYFIGVMGYFFLMFVMSFLHDLFKQKLIENILLFLGTSIPMILAIYFTFILFKTTKK